MNIPFLFFQEIKTNFDSFMIMENNLLLRIDFIEALLLLYKS